MQLLQTFILKHLLVLHKVKIKQFINLSKINFIKLAYNMFLIIKTLFA